MKMIGLRQVRTAVKVAHAICAQATGIVIVI